MKNTYIIVGVIVVVAILAFVFGSKKETEVIVEDNSDSTLSYALSDGDYQVNTETSQIKWSGEYVGGSSEEGTVGLASGNLMIASGAPAGGNFEIDLESISDSSGNTVFVNLIKGEKGLDTETNPTANFRINKVLPNPVAGTSTGKYIIDGWLTVKGTTKAISFPVNLSEDRNTIAANSYFAINLKDWGVNLSNLVGNSIIIEFSITASK